jgi:hypothetical protein
VTHVTHPQVIGPTRARVREQSEPDVTCVTLAIGLQWSASAQSRCSGVSTGGFRLTPFLTPTDFHIRCSIHRKCPHSARFCDHACCLDPISAPIGRSVLVVNRSAPSTRRSFFARGSPALVSDRVGDRRAMVTTPKKTGGGCRVGGKLDRVRKFHLYVCFRGLVSKSWVLCVSVVRRVGRLTAAT